ncbi:MAG: hypothetical protein ACREBS_03990 [Nitrososphaerales archaeon]
MPSAKKTEEGGILSSQSLSSFFTIARFGPDTLVIFGLLIASTVSLLFYGLVYFSLMTAGALVVIFLVESVETIGLARAESRQIVGAKCMVLKQTSLGERGIVKLFAPDGRLDPELWSAESNTMIRAGEVARVTGIRSIILEVTTTNRDELSANVTKAKGRPSGELIEVFQP